MSETQTYKTITLLPDALENRIVAVSAAVFMLKLINKAKIREALDEVKKLAQACDADGAVNFTLLIAYPDLHALRAYGFFGAEFQSEFIDDLRIEIQYILTDEHGCYHFVSPMQSSYVEKYFAKASVAA